MYWYYSQTFNASGKIHDNKVSCQRGSCHPTWENIQYLMQFNCPSNVISSAVLFTNSYWRNVPWMNEMDKILAWRRNQMEAFSVLLALCERNPTVTGGFPSQKPVTPSFDIFFDLRLNKRWNKTMEVPAISDTHYCDVIMDAVASQITSLTIVYSTVYSDGDQRKHQRSAPLAFVRGIHRWPMNSPHKCPVSRKMFPFDDVIMHPVHFDVTVMAHVFHRAMEYHLHGMLSLLKWSTRKINDF